MLDTNATNINTIKTNVCTIPIATNKISNIITQLDTNEATIQPIQLISVILKMTYFLI